MNNELPGRTAGPYAPLYKRYTVCVSAVRFGLGSLALSLSVALEVYWTRAIV